MNTAESIRPEIRRYLRMSLGLSAGILLLSATVATGTLTEAKARTAWANFGVCPTQAACNTFVATMTCTAPCQTLNFGAAGEPAKDFQFGNSDFTISVSPNSETEISSGMGTGSSVGTTGNCNPKCPIPGTVAACSDCVANGNCASQGTCGPHPSAYFSYYYDSIQDMSYLFMRMRLAQNPTNGGGNVRGTGFLASHFNFLVDFDGDGFKEFWLDVDGGCANGSNPDCVNVYYSDRLPGTNQIENDCDAPGLKASNCNDGTIPANRVNLFKGCTDESDTGASADCARSLTRAVYVRDPNAPDDWFIDIQIPMAALTPYNGDNPGTSNIGYPGTTGQTTGPRASPFYTWASSRDLTNERRQFYPLSQTGASAPFKGNGPFAYVPSTTGTSNVPQTLPTYLRFNVATSQSATDPLQKDFLLLGYSAPTPVTLSRFNTTPSGLGYRVDWSTANELGNVGFHLWANGPGGWVKLNEKLIPSRSMDSLEAQDYTFDAPGSNIGATEFRIVDVAADGTERTHGPFAAGQEFGGRSEAEPIDWKKVSDETGAKATVRGATARSRALDMSRNAASSVSKGTPPGLAGYPEARFRVTEDGLYRVSYEQLAAAGVDLSGVPAALFALTSRYGSVPVRVEGGKGGVFGPGGFVEFYGEAVRSPYTRTNVYRLAVNPHAALQVSEDPAPAGKAAPVTSYLATAEVHRDRFWSPGSPTDDPWYDDSLFAFSPLSRDFAIDLDNVVASGGVEGASAFVGLWGSSVVLPNGRDHHVQASLNGSLFADKVFTGVAASPLSAQVDPRILREGRNAFTIRMPMDTGASYEINVLDRYSVTYPRAFVAKNGRLSFTAEGSVFRVSGLPSRSVVVYRYTAKKAERLTGLTVTGVAGDFAVTFRGATGSARYVVASEDALGSPSIAAVPTPNDPAVGAARYLVISHPDFIGGLDALVAARQAQGLTVKVVDVNDAYERFSGGVIDPQAIKDFIAHSAGAGTEYVLLVGGDSFDYLNNMRTGSVSFVPTFYVRTSPLVGFAPADGVFADLDGDLVADLAIGRLPVKSSADLAAVLAKTLAYPSAASARKAVFVADRRDGSDVYSDMSDLAIAKLGHGWQARTAYVEQIGVAAARDTMVAAINGGTAFTSYIGHSDVTYWSFERLFRAADMSRLTNASAPTVVSQWGCWNTFFVHPTLISLSDRFLLTPDRGAAAVIGPATLSKGEGSQQMSSALTEQLAQPGTTLGKALAAAKARVAASHPESIDVLRATNLMGDPALIVP